MAVKQCCLDCGRECQTAFCDACAPPPRDLGRDRGERCPPKRWNNSTFHVSRSTDALVPAKVALGR
jgi:hypothetical protein